MAIVAAVYPILEAASLENTYLDAAVPRGLSPNPELAVH